MTKTKPKARRSKRAPGGSVDPVIERARIKAERTYARALRQYDDAMDVLYEPRAVRAATSLIASAKTMDHAMQVLARPTCRRLGLETTEPAEDLSGVLELYGPLDMARLEFNGMREHVISEPPPRKALNYWLRAGSRLILDEFTRIGRLQPDSPEYGQIQEVMTRAERQAAREKSSRWKGECLSGKWK